MKHRRYEKNRNAFKCLCKILFVISPKTNCLYKQRKVKLARKFHNENYMKLGNQLKIMYSQSVYLFNSRRKMRSRLGSYVLTVMIKSRS